MAGPAGGAVMDIDEDPPSAPQVVEADEPIPVAQIATGGVPAAPIWKPKCQRDADDCARTVADLHRKLADCQRKLRTSKQRNRRQERLVKDLKELLKKRPQEHKSAKPFAESRPRTRRQNSLLLVGEIEELLQRYRVERKAKSEIRASILERGWRPSLDPSR